MDSSPDTARKGLAAVPDDHSHTQAGVTGRSVLARVRRAVLVTVLLAVAFFVGGFLHFATNIGAQTAPQKMDADAIVVLTGGAARITGALDLLADGHAKRLLISGVHPRTSRAAIARHANRRADLFACCVDLDYKAEDTIGNAEQARNWVLDNGFKSLIVVTSAYHMPRSMAELKNSLPDVELYPYPVVRADLNLDRWYTNWAASRLLMREYLKYIAARLRLSMNIPGDMQRMIAAIVIEVPHNG